jgi:hypothetical protein
MSQLLAVIWWKYAAFGGFFVLAVASMREAWKRLLRQSEKAEEERERDWRRRPSLLIGNRAGSTFIKTMGRAGIEPATLGLRGPCSAG